MQINGTLILLYIIEMLPRTVSQVYLSVLVNKILLMLQMDTHILKPQTST